MLSTLSIGGAVNDVQGRDSKMTGLEDRLRGVSGVSDIVIELGDDGLEGIRVRMSDGTDEADVLEEIRRILVAYGLKGSTRSGRGVTGIPNLELGSDDENPVKKTTSLVHAGYNADSADSVPPSEARLPTPTIIPAGDRLTVRLSSGDRTVDATSDASPLGAADAMMRAVCEWQGATPPDRLVVDRLDLDGSDVVILVGRKDGVSVVGSSLVGGSLAMAIQNATSQVIAGLAAV